MKKLKNYIALMDNGYSQFAFEFTSNARANSKANIYAAKTQYYNRTGLKCKTVLETFLDPIQRCN